MRRFVVVVASLVVLARPEAADAVKVTVQAASPAPGKGIVVDRFGTMWWITANGTGIAWSSVWGTGASGSRTVTGAVQMNALVEGADGTLWAADRGANKIIHIATGSGSDFGFTPPTAASEPYDLVLGPDLRIYFTEYAGNRIGRLTQGGVFSVATIDEVAIANTPNSHPTGIAVAGKSNDIWFVENTGNKLGYVSPDLFTPVFEKAIPTAGAFPIGLAGGYDTVAFTEGGINSIGVYTISTNQFSEIPIPTASSSPQGIVLGTDGAFWFTESIGNKIGRLKDGMIDEFGITTPVAVPRDIVRGGRSDFWFTAEGASSLGHLELSVPGDLNGDGNVGVADVFYLINFLFAGGPPLK